MVSPQGSPPIQQPWLTITRYCHSVTKARSRVQHEEKGGGILADEMGMGKSLSILALIVKTMEGGRSWAEEQKTAEAVNAIKIHSRATLVVVSSAREFSRTQDTSELRAKQDLVLINGWLNEIET
jgi:SNF2 family DNA or RNA helicase